MKILLVSNQSPNKEGIGNPVISRMTDALCQDNRIESVCFEPVFYSISSLLGIRKKSKHCDIVHIHFGGLYAVIIRLFLIGVHARKFITFHGTDIHAKALNTTSSAKQKIKIYLNQKASFLCIILYDKCGFVAEEMEAYVPERQKPLLQRKAFIQPLGVEYTLFCPMNKEEARKHLGLEGKRYVLFSNISNTCIKRKDLAESIVKELGQPYVLLTMSGVKPSEVPYYINACDFVLLTSDEEGSPNIIREALSLNKPVFSVDVGDAVKQLEGLANSAIISRDIKEASKTILEKMQIQYVDNTREVLESKLNFTRLNNFVVEEYTKALTTRS